METTAADPLGSHDLTRPAGAPAASHSRSATRPLALRHAVPAARRDLPEHRYDHVRQLAVDAHGTPLTPFMAKDWTSYQSTHTDGDGGDNETWGWEEK